MDNKEFNERRHNRKKQECRFRLGIQQFWNYPIINLLWILFAGGVVLMVIAEKRFVANMEVYPLFESVFSACMTIMLVIFPVICAIGLIQLVGFCFAIRDEADMEIVFGDKRDMKKQPPILYYKKRDRKSGVTKREFYTTIPMERWKEKKDAICDRLRIFSSILSKIAGSAITIPSIKSLCTCTFISCSSSLLQQLSIYISDINSS